MLLTILGGAGVWPTARQACGGYLLEHDGYSILIDPGYGVLPRLLAVRGVGSVDAVLVSHGHLDHCADLNPLLRARAMGTAAYDPLPVFAPTDALKRIFAAERVKAVARAADVANLVDGASIELGPFRVEIAMLPHHLPNAGMRITAGGHVVAYTGDSGDCLDRIALARGADVLVAEATFVDEIPPDEAAYLSSARQVAGLALAAEARSTILTHQWPDRSAELFLAASRGEGLSSARVAFAGMSVNLAAAATEPQSLVTAAQARRASQEAAQLRDIPVVPRRAAG